MSRINFDGILPPMDAETLAQFKAWGRKGGFARKRSLTPKRRLAIARKASRAAAKKRRNGA